MEIERQQEMVSEGLLEEDKFLAEVNLEDLESTNGDRQEYWLLAIKSAQKAKTIQDATKKISRKQKGKGNK